MDTTRLRHTVALPGNSAGEGVDAPFIQLAQFELGIQFPPDYLQFLQEFGRVIIGPYHIDGLGGDMLEVVRTTLLQRQLHRPYLSYLLIPVMEEEGGLTYCIDASRFSEGMYPVVCWDASLGVHQSPPIVAPDFATWLDGLIDAWEAATRDEPWRYRPRRIIGS